MIELGPGVVFAGYTIERRLGAGGWGTVYLARDPRLPRSVALKLLDPARASDEARRRFEREADLTAGLEHPDIVTIYDRGVEGETPWIAMQYVPGNDASTLRNIEPAHALRIGSRVADALDYAHAAGVLHRDVKPSNILIAEAEPGRPEQILLSDFGIARLRDSASRLTETGSVTGTAAYVSPEQISGGTVDHRSDQYSLACSLFVLLTGRPPFPVTDSLALMHAHVYTPPVLPGEVDPDLAALDAVFGRALAKQPDDRFGTCAEFTAAAQDALATSMPTRTASTPAPSTPARPAPPVHRLAGRTPTLMAAAAALIAVVALAAWGITALEPFSAAEDAAEPRPAAGNAIGWDARHSPAAHAFPGLVGEKNANNGWNGATCTENDPGTLENVAYRNSARISCTVPMNGDDDKLSFDIHDRTSTTTAGLGIDELITELFDGCEPQVQGVQHPAGSTLPVARCEGVDYSREIDTSDHRIYVWTFFPDKPRSQYLIVARWPGHTVNELIEDWWKKIPLGG
ncbi:serine/threonine-protein kinase [Nocardia sp. NPDC051750]|uniref:serine/threonine-protein kinase n=1 Tax=Nocardia sp. NPDC051750 TaxID=3364325 RepID=UPI0037BB517A